MNNNKIFKMEIKMKDKELSKVKVKCEVLVKEMKMNEDKQITIIEIYEKRLLKKEDKSSKRIIHKTN